MNISSHQTDLKFNFLVNCDYVVLMGPNTEADLLGLTSCLATHQLLIYSKLYNLSVAQFPH